MHCRRPEPDQNYWDKMFITHPTFIVIHPEVRFTVSMVSGLWDNVLLLIFIFLSLCWLANNQVLCIGHCLNPQACSSAVQSFLVLLPWGQYKPVESNFALITSRQGISGIINLRFANQRSSYRTSKSFEITLDHLKLWKDSLAAEHERHFPMFTHSPRE